ncbi:ChrR family anti-sigma-E factor [Shewanella maritima]|uniref:ChrR family anti-sigma-E factor n=1 Tax=Shewanella maritima TaxID=2520507 RepID=UPI0037369533
MINFHPDESMLTLHANGQLPLSLSIALSAHADFCPQCRQMIESITVKASEQAMDDSNNAPSMPLNEDEQALNDLLSNMLSELDNMPEFQQRSTEHQLISVKGEQYSLPSAFNQQSLSNWQGIGKVSRARLDTGEPQARASLLHIEAKGEIPQHTHKGTELTLLLAGEFSDEFNTYGPGDFMLLNSEHEHSPKTMKGCLCYTVVDAPLYFTKGMSKLLNPIGELIY